jgi:RNA polymerase sigma-B factor
MLTLDLADSTARRYQGRGIDTEDLTQVARLALVKAVRGYRPGRGHGFVAYAIPTMSGEIKRHFRDCGWSVRPPRRLQEIRGRIGPAEERLRQRLHREPTEVEIADELGVTRAELDAARQATSGYHAISFEGRYPDDPTLDVADSCDDFSTLLEHDALSGALSALTAREQQILRLRFVEERTQSEIGRAVGVSQMQVSRLLSTALARLRSQLAQAGYAA